MCKIFAMTNLEKVNVNQRFLKVVESAVCKFDNSGFGYAVLNKDGSTWGERTIKPDGFTMRINKPSSVTSLLPIVTNVQNTFGKYIPNNNKMFLGHGRLSTNTINLPNTHPYVDSGITLIHNGVVDDANTENPVKCKTDNDTEILLQYWIKGGMKAIETNVTGYYAMGIFQKGLMHIIRDNKASLYISYCRTVDSFIIATKSEIIEEIAQEMRWKIETPEQITDNTHTVFDGNDILSHTMISPKGFASDKFGSKADKALGKSYKEDDVTKIYDSDGNRVYSDRDFRSVTSQGDSSSTLEDIKARELLEKELEGFPDGYLEGREDDEDTVDLFDVYNRSLGR